MKWYTRRNILGRLARWTGILATLPLFQRLNKMEVHAASMTAKTTVNSLDDQSPVYWVKNGNPAENIDKILEMMGGIERFVGRRDIVILKPNAQWWNQGRTNLWAMKRFIDHVLMVDGFEGEIIIAENQHFMDTTLPEGEQDNIRGWIKKGEINGDIDGENHTLNSMIQIYNKQGIENVSKAHWRDGGPKQPNSWGSGQNGGVVNSPVEGDGYVWADEEFVFRKRLGLKSWRVKMSYPIFTSGFSGITVDMKNGAFQRDGRGGGVYLKERPVKLINFAVLNSHGEDTGITSAVKNYMGITDMSCGRWGERPQGYVNVHQCGGKKYAYAKAGPLGHFMKTIRLADLNIITAEWVGWGDRTDISKASRERSILAGVDPIAVDYCGAKHLVLPLSKQPLLHDPDDNRSSIFKFLRLAQKSMGKGNMEEKGIKLIRYNLET